MSVETTVAPRFLDVPFALTIRIAGYAPPGPAFAHGTNSVTFLTGLWRSWHETTDAGLDGDHRGIGFNCELRGARPG
jgi:hypothetical protein